MKKVLILGSRGRLGAALVRKWSSTHAVQAVSRAGVDVSDIGALTAFLGEAHFDVLVNCTGMTSLEQCEDEPELAWTVNATAVKVMAGISSQKNARLLHFSTDYVFDGTRYEPYTEDLPARPLSEYGRSKLGGEEEVLADAGNHVVVRVSWVFGPEKPSFVDMILKGAMTKDTVQAVGDKTSSPTYTEDVADWMKPFLSQETPPGLYHACNSGRCTWQEYGQEAVHLAAAQGWPLKCRTVGSVPMSSMTAFRAVRPVHTVMDCSKLAGVIGQNPRPWQEALRDYMEAQKPPAI